MSYKNSAKNRRLKRKLMNFVGIIKFKGLSMPATQKITLVGILIVIISLFLSWSEGGINSNAFAGYLGIKGYIILILSIIILILLTSNNKKEIIKTTLGIAVKDSLFILFVNIIILILILNSYFIISNLNTLAYDIVTPSNGIILATTGIIISIIGNIMTLKKKQTVILNTDYEEKENYIDEIQRDKSNMKLPF